MASYNPPSENLPIFDNSVFTSSDSSSGGLTLAQANALYLRKTYPDTCTAYQKFDAGLETTTMLVTSVGQVQGIFYPNGGVQGTGIIRTTGDIFSTGGKVYGTSLETSGNGNLKLGTGNITSVKDITASGTITGTFSGPTSGNIKSNSIEPVLTSNNMDIATTQIDGILNIGTAARTANINIGTNATNNQLSIGSNSNTQTNVYGGLVYIANDTEINGDLTMTSGSIIGYLTTTIAAATYATITQLGLYLTIASASATYLTQTSATATYATIAQLGNYLTTVTAAATYLTITNAASTYATIVQLGNYLTTAAAATTYLTITNAASTYATIVQLGNYLTTADAVSTYLSITNAASTYLSQTSAASTYLSITNAASTYLTQTSAASIYATITQLSNYLTITTASTTYLSIVNAASTYLTQANAAITYATIVQLANYLTITSASATYAPKTAPSFNTSLTLTSGNVAFGTGNITTVKNITSSGNITATGNISTATGTISGATVSAGDFSGIGPCNLSLNTGNITSCNDITASGTISCDSIDTTLPANNLDICQGTTYTGAVNIATNPTSTADGIFLGNSFNPTTVNGNLTVLGTLTAGGFTPGTSALNTITSVLPADNVQLYDNQTTGTISLGGSSTRTGSISIGTNPTSAAGGIFLGNNFNPTTVNGNLTVLGTLTAGSSITSFDTLVTSTPTTNANLYNNQTSAIINLGNDVSRTGAINIGNGNTDVTISKEYKFRGVNIDGITDGTTYGILNNVVTSSIRLGHAVTSGTIALGNNKTSGEMNIMNNQPGTHNLNIMDNGNGAINMIRNSTTTAYVNIANTWKIWKNNFEFFNLTTSFNFLNNLTSTVTMNMGGFGTLNIGTITSNPINIGGSGVVTVKRQITVPYDDTISFTQGSVDAQNGIINTYFLPIGLSKSHIGYNFNLPLVTITGVGTTGYRYNPATNIANDYNFVNAGHYVCTVNTVYRYTNNPTAFTMSYNTGVATGTTTGTVTTSTVTVNLPASRTNTATLMGGGNNNDFSQTYTLSLAIPSPRFVNFFFNINTISITTGTVVLNIYGTVVRIA